MSKILDLKNYDLIFTTSFFYTHGVSGHLYELIDYCYICRASGINAGILLADGVTKDTFKTAILNKYNFTASELDDILSNTIECHKPLIIRSNNVCIVDGSWRILNCTIYADNVFLLRCSEDDFTYFSDSRSIKHTHLMQDFKLYPERFTDLNITVIDYVKKLLWGKFHKPQETATSTGLLYLTTACRAITLDSVKNIINKALCDKYLIVTNDIQLYGELAGDTVIVEQAPVKDIFTWFSTYIYTPTDLQKDCSPRFIVECAIYGKDVVYEIDYVCDGIERRKSDIKDNLAGLELTKDDFFITYFKSITDAKDSKNYSS